MAKTNLQPRQFSGRAYGGKPAGAWHQYIGLAAWIACLLLISIVSGYGGDAGESLGVDAQMLVAPALPSNMPETVTNTAQAATK